MGILSARIAKIRHEKISPYVKGDVLDLGCGEAMVLNIYGSKISNYCGIERSAQKVENLSKEYPNANFLKRDLDQDLIGAGKQFDCILMTAIIEHIFNQKFVMEQLVHMLKPQGKIIITTPTPWGNGIVYPIGVFLGLFARSALNDHIVIYNRHRINIMAKEVGLKIQYYSTFLLFCNQMAILEKA